MTNEEAVRMLKAKLECMIRDVSGCDDDCNRKLCGECHLNYEQGNMGEQKECLRMSIEALERESCEDAISRQAVDDAIYDYSRSCDVNYQQIMEFIEKIPPVTPQPKMGRWIQTNEFFINQDGQFIYKFICSECKSLSYFRKSNKKAIGANVCPNCGAKMEAENG